jgi:hypothetical protein
VEEVLLLSLDPTPAWRPGHRSCWCTVAEAI